MLVRAGDEAGIGGFIITGNTPKQVLLEAIGPTLFHNGVPNPLTDPTLELSGSSGLIMMNDNWRDTQEAEIEATGIAPPDDLESAILITLDPGNYTAIVREKENRVGVGLVAVYDLGQANGKLSNISTRAYVSTNDDVMIAGFILGNKTNPDAGPTNVILRGIGPSLTAFGVPNALNDPTLELRDTHGTLLIANDNWQDDPAQAALVTAAGLAPTNTLESAIAATLPGGIYTAILAAKGIGVGNGLVEVYDLADSVSFPSPTPTTTPTPGGTPTPSASPSPSAGACTENFDGVTAPALPPGWVASNPDPGDGTTWVISTSMPDTPPNSLFTTDQDGISDKVIDRQNVTLNNASAVFSFRNKFNTEFSDGIYWDGYVLEVSSPNISGGEFLDITDSHVGGSFVSGGYTGEISGKANNPLAGRMAWSGDSGGYIDTVINLGPNLAGQTVIFRFRVGTDEAVAAPGIWIDTIWITNSSCP